MIYCPKHCSQTLLGRCADCDKLREQERGLLRAVRKARQVGRSWIGDFWHSLTHKPGYRVIVRIGVILVQVGVTSIAAYFGLYGIMAAQHELKLNRAAFERSAFTDLVTSNNRGAFVAAMQNFGPTQNIRVTGEPAFWPLFSVRIPLSDGKEEVHTWRWLSWSIPWFTETYTPNRDPLWRWAKYFLPLCEAALCGNPYTTPHIRIELADANFSQAYLPRVDLSGANLTGVNLSEAELTQVILRGANFVEDSSRRTQIQFFSIRIPINAAPADLTRVKLSFGDLRGVNFAKVTLVEANFQGADLGKANLRGANLSKANFFGANLSAADLSGANLTKANLSTANLAGTSFVGATLTEATLLLARVTGADFTNAHGLTREQIGLAAVDQTTKLPLALTEVE